MTISLFVLPISVKNQFLNQNLFGISHKFNHKCIFTTFVYFLFSFTAMLVYRLFRCCNKLAAKLLHTLLYLLAVPCIVVSTIAVFDSHNLNPKPIPNLYSLHSWLGLVTMGLFALQVTHTVSWRHTLK